MGPNPQRLQDSDNNANSAVLATLAEDLQTIRSSPIFAGIEQAAPQGIDPTKGSLSGFHQVTFSAKSYETAMASMERYKVGVNFFAQNLLFSAAPGVPMSQASIDVMAMMNSRPALMLASATSGPKGTATQAASEVVQQD